jgi:hypothetical protein
LEKYSINEKNGSQAKGKQLNAPRINIKRIPTIITIIGVYLPKY